MRPERKLPPTDQNKEVSVPKILQIINSCGGCPHSGYGSGGRDDCHLVNEVIPDKAAIAPFCPLTEFPSSMIANMGETIRLLREPNKYGIVLAILSHIATKLKKGVGRNGGITIELKGNRKATVYLRHDGITSVVPFQGAVFFVDGEFKYKLYPDTLPPQLHVQVIREGITDELWQQLYIAT